MPRKLHSIGYARRYRRELKVNKETLILLSNRTTVFAPRRASCGYSSFYRCTRRSGTVSAPIRVRNLDPYSGRQQNTRRIPHEMPASHPRYIMALVRAERRDCHSHWSPFLSTTSVVVAQPSLDT